MNSAVQVILFIFAFQISLLKSFEFPITDRDICKTPDGKFGSCVDIRQCQSIKSYIKQCNYVFTAKLRQYLRERTCEYIGHEIRVCCPEAPIVNNLDQHFFQPNSNDVEHKNAKLLPFKCGINKNQNVATLTTTTTNNGKEATLNEFPWIAMLSYSTDNGNSTTDKCVGTIINERYILTAANCINDKLFSVRVGEHNTATNPDCQRGAFNVNKCSPSAQDIRIEKAFQHENFSHSFTFNDIGLIRLSKPLNIYTVNVQAICLPLEKSTKTIDTRRTPLLLAGWGVTKTRFINTVLLKEKVSIISKEECIQTYEKDSHNLLISDSQFCTTRQRSDNSNLCSGDTGSPVQMLNDLRYTQYGIVSIGSRLCTRKLIPIVNTRVDQYIEWILNHIEP